MNQNFLFYHASNLYGNRYTGPGISASYLFIKEKIGSNPIGYPQRNYDNCYQRHYPYIGDCDKEIQIMFEDLCRDDFPYSVGHTYFTSFVEKEKRFHNNISLDLLRIRDSDLAMEYRLRFPKYPLWTPGSELIVC